MWGFSRYSGMGGGFGGGGSSNQQVLSDIYNSLSNIQGAIGNVNNTTVTDSSDTLLKNQQDLEDLLNEKLGLMTDAITKSSITDISSNIAMVQAINNSSSNQNSKLQLLADAITNSSNNDISSNTSLVTAISNSVNNQSSNNDTLITTLVEKITESRDNIMNKLISLDNSFNKINNETMQVISNNDASFNQALLNHQLLIDNNKTQILSKMLDIDLSFNVAINNKTAEFLTKLIDAETNFNNVLLATDASFSVALSNNTTTMINKMVDLDISLNSNVGDNTYGVLNKLIDAQTEFNNKLLQTDISFNNQLNQSTQLIFDKINNSDISFNNNLTNILTRMVETDLSYNTALSNNTTAMLSKLVNYDISVNSAITQSTSNILTKIVETDLSFNLALGEFSLDLFKKVDINFTDISLNVDLGGGLVDAIDKMVMYDASLNQRIIDSQLVISNKHTDLISRFDTSYNLIYDKISDVLIANSTISESVNDNFTDLMQSLNIKSNDTQQALTEYIGKYIVVPLYEQRLNDIVILYYERFNNEILSPIETALNYFRKGNFAELSLSYGPTTQEIMAMKILNFKNQAFEKLLSTSPDAKGFNDMTDEAVKYYKQIRNYVSWGYKSLDGLSKAIELNNKVNNLEAANELATIDQDILNDPEKLELYSELTKRVQDGTLFTVETGVDIAGLIQLQPKYQEYVCRYGWPSDGNFEAEKLAIITKDLIEAGVIPDPDNSDPLSTASDTDTGTGTGTATGDETATGTGTGTDTTGDFSTSCTDTDPSGNQESGSEDCSNPDSSGNYTDTDSCTGSISTSTCKDTSSEKDSCKDTSSEKDSCKKTSSESRCESIKSSLCKSFIDSNSIQDNFSDCDLSDFEQNINNTAVKYFVYITVSGDILHEQNTYYYPLFTDKTEAKKAIDISHNGYNSSIDVIGNIYTPNDPSNADYVTKFTFQQLPGKEFWMPNSHPYRSVGTPYHPPLGLEYIFYTPYTGLSGIEYNPYKSRDAHSFELNVLSLKKYLMDAPTIVGPQSDPVPTADLTVNIPWEADIDASLNNWRNLFKFKTNATVIDDLYNENITFITDHTQWYGGNLLKDAVIPNGEYYDTISFDYIKHITNEISGNELYYITNVPTLLADLSNNPINVNIKTLLLNSDVSGENITSGDVETSVVDVSANNPAHLNVIPFTVFTQLLRNSTLGYNRVTRLLDSRNNTNDILQLLQQGDKIIFNITLSPQVDSSGNITSPVPITKKTYRIVLTLI